MYQQPSLLTITQQLVSIHLAEHLSSCTAWRVHVVVSKQLHDAFLSNTLAEAAGITMDVFKCSTPMEGWPLTDLQHAVILKSTYYMLGNWQNYVPGNTTCQIGSSPIEPIGCEPSLKHQNEVPPYTISVAIFCWMLIYRCNMMLDDNVSYQFQLCQLEITARREQKDTTLLKQRDWTSPLSHTPHAKTKHKAVTVYIATQKKANLPNMYCLNKGQRFGYRMLQEHIQESGDNLPSFMVVSWYFSCKPIGWQAAWIPIPSATRRPEKSDAMDDTALPSASPSPVASEVSRGAAEMHPSEMGKPWKTCRKPIFFL